MVLKFGFNVQLFFNTFVFTIFGVVFKLLLVNTLILDILSMQYA